MALLPKIQNKDVYSFKDAQALINPSNVSSEKGKAISTDLYNRVYQAEKQSNEELLEQLKDMSVIRNVIEEVVPDEKERTELYAQYSALQRALEENSSSLKGISKTITQSFMKKGLGKNGQFTQAQDILMSVGGGIKGELFPVFQGIIDQTSTFFKNRSDRKERVEEGIMKNIGSKPSSNNNTTEEYSSERKNFSNVTNGENNTSILEHIDMNVDELLSKFKTEDGRIDAFKVESFLSELSDKFGGPLEAEIFGEAMRDILSVELSKLSSEQIKEFKDSMKSEKGNLLLERTVSFDGYNEDEKPVIIDTLKEMMSSQADLLMSPKREMKDFTSLEAQEEYQRDSIKEQRRTADSIEKLCGILTGDKRKYSSNDSNSGGGIISNLIDSGKDLLLAKMGLDKFFGKDKASKGGAIKKTPGGLSSKSGGLFKKVGGWLTTLGGGALLSGGGTSDIGDVATDVLTDTATDKVIDKAKPSSKPKSSIFSKLKNAFNIVKESKTVNAIKEGGMKLVRFGGDKAVQGARTVAANPLTSATVGAVIAAGAANKYAHTELGKTEHGRSVLEATDGNLLSDDIDYDAIGGTLDIAESGLDAFGNVKDEEKFSDVLKKQKQEAWERENYTSAGFREIAGDADDKKLAWEVWHREKFDEKYKSLSESGGDISQLKKDFSKEYENAYQLNYYGVYFDRDKLAEQSIQSGGEVANISSSQNMTQENTTMTDSKGESKTIFKEELSSKTKQGTGNVTKSEDGSYVLSVSGTTLHRMNTTSNDGSITNSPNIDYITSKSDGTHNSMTSFEEHTYTDDGTHSKFLTYLDTVEDTQKFSDISELKNAAPETNKSIVTQKSGFHKDMLNSIFDGVDNIDTNVANEAYGKYSSEIESASLVDEGLRDTLLKKVKNKVLQEYSKNKSKTSELTQQSSNSIKNDAYTSRPTRTSVSEKKDTSTQKQETKQQPTVINNFNTTNNNVTQSAPQRSPQLLINPSGSYMGERQPTSR